MRKLERYMTFLEKQAAFALNDVAREAETARFAALKFEKLAWGIAEGLRIEDGNNDRANKIIERTQILAQEIDEAFVQNKHQRYQSNRTMDITMSNEV